MNLKQEIAELLDKHGEFYVRETMKYITSGKGGDPYFTKPNKQDLKSAQALYLLFQKWGLELVEDFREEEQGK